MSGNAPAQERTSRVFRLSGAKSPIPRDLLDGYRQFAPDPSLGAHRSRYPQNSKCLPVASNSSKRGLTIRGTFTPSAGLRARARNPGARRRRLTLPHSLNGAYRDTSCQVLWGGTETRLIAESIDRTWE